MTAVETARDSVQGREAKRSRSLLRPRNLLAVLLLVVVIGAAMAAKGASMAAPPAPAPAAAPVLSAHGVVEPVAQATIASISGGVVRSLPARVGQQVEEGQRIAEISAGGLTDVLVAPWSGTVMGLQINRGDTVMPGAVVAVIGDLSRYRVRTNDVDEYLIGRIKPGQGVTMTVEALEGRKIAGAVETVALVQQVSGAGALNYPVVIGLASNDPDLRPGMSVRVVFP